MATFEAWSFAAAIVSVVLAIVAMALSGTFFWFSYKQAEKSSEASTNIGKSVEKLEVLFTKVMEMAFDEMAKGSAAARDMAMANIRKDQPIDEERLQEIAASMMREQTEEMKQEVSAKVSDTMTRQQVEELIDQIIPEAMRSGQKVELSVRDREIRPVVIEVLSAIGYQHPAVRTIAEVANLSISEVIRVLEILLKEGRIIVGRPRHGRIEWGEVSAILPSTRVMIAGELAGEGVLP